MKDTICIMVGKDHIFACGTRVIARTGESESTQLEITLADELCECWAYLDFKKENGETFKTPRLDITNSKIVYDIPLGLLDIDGDLSVQLVLQNETGVIWKSDKKKFYVRKSIDATDDIPDKEDFITEAQKTLDEALEIAKSVEERANNGEFNGKDADLSNYYTKEEVDTKIDVVEVVINQELKPILDDYYTWEHQDLEVKNGFYDGTIFYSNDSYRSVLCNCSGGEKYKINTYLLAGSKWAIVYLYDSNNNCIGKLGGYFDSENPQTEDTYYTDFEFTTPDNCTYFITNSFYISWYPFNVYKQITNADKQRYRETSFRELNHLNIEDGIYDGGNFYPNGSYQSIKVDCASGEFYQISAYFYGASQQPVAQFYSVDNRLLGTTERITEDKQITDYQIVIPDECTWFVAINFKTPDANFVIKKYIDGAKPLFQKNYVALGDSITYIGGGWRTWFNEKTGATEILCTAVSGAHLCDYEDTIVDGVNYFEGSKNTLSNQVQSILNNPPIEPIDFIIISAGTNDHAELSEFNGGVTQFADETTMEYLDIDAIDRTRYDGAMRWIAEKLWTVFPNAVIFWCTPIQSAENVRNTWVQILKSNYMQEIATYLACPVIDATRKSGIYGRYEINGANGKYLSDGLHPNLAGRKKLGYYYASEIINYYSYEID